MSVWAIADLHLSFGVKDKSMERFGWIDWTGRIERSWRERVAAQDLVLIAGDISWAMRVEEAIPDLLWIDQLPGTKVMIRGNHDYWWPSLKKLQEVLPPSIHAIHNTAFLWNEFAVAGTRLWDSTEYAFGQFVERVGGPPPEGGAQEAPDEAEKIFMRELGRLEMSLKAMDRRAKRRLAMTHYPPIGADLKPSRASALLEKYGVEACVFGHIHNLRRDAPLFGTARGVRYLLTACDYLDMVPIQVC
jgi:predicted phosphohydrolase